MHRPLSLKAFFATTLSLLMVVESAQAFLYGPGSSSAFALSIPSSLGFVSESYSPHPTTAAAPDMILIQDLHVNRSVQFAISGILKHLKAQGLMPDRIAVEGDVGPVDIISMQRYPDPVVRKQVADYMIEQGEMPGAMHFAVSEGEGGLFGIETEEYYQANLEMFRRSYQGRMALRQELDKIQAVLPKLERNRATHENATTLRKDIDAVELLINNQVVPDELSATLRRTNEAIEHLKLVLPEESAASLVEPLSAAVNFYALALLRNEELFRNTLAARELGQQKTTIVVAGGFHTHALEELCKRHGFSYAVITPDVKIDDNVDKRLYVERLLDHHMTRDQAEYGIDVTMQMIQPMFRTAGNIFAGFALYFNTLRHRPLTSRLADAVKKGTALALCGSAAACGSNANPLTASSPGFTQLASGGQGEAEDTNLGWFASYITGNFNIPAGYTLRLKFPSSQVGINVIVTVGPTGVAANQPIGVLPGIYSIQPGHGYGFVDVPNMPAISGAEVAAHSGTNAWYISLNQPFSAQATISEIEMGPPGSAELNAISPGSFIPTGNGILAFFMPSLSAQGEQVKRVVPADIPSQALVIPVSKQFPPVKSHVDYAMVDPGPGQGSPGGGMGTNVRARNIYGQTNRAMVSGAPVDDVLLGDQISVYERQGDRTFATPLGRREQNDARLSGWAWDRGQNTSSQATFYGLFPHAWWDYPTTSQSPAHVRVHQFSPIIPGDLEASSLPVTVYEVVLENPSSEATDVSVMMSLTNWEGWGVHYSEGAKAEQAVYSKRGDGQVHHLKEDRNYKGVVMGARQPSDRRLNGQLALVAQKEPGVDISYQTAFDVSGSGSGVWDSFARDGHLPNQKPISTGGQEQAGAVALKVTLQPGEKRTVAFATAEDTPNAVLNEKPFARYYTRRYGTQRNHAFDIASRALQSRQHWNQQINSWQATILNDASLPDHLKTMLINEVYYPVMAGVTVTRDGHFYLYEGITYKILNTLDVWFYTPLLAQLYPELEKNNIRDFARFVHPADKSIQRYANPFPSVGLGEPSYDEALREGKAFNGKPPFYDGWSHYSGAVLHHLDRAILGPLSGVDYFSRPPDALGTNEIHMTWQNHNTWKDLSPKFVLMAWRAYVMSGQKDTRFLQDVWPAIKETLEYHKRFTKDGLPNHGGGVSPVRAYPDQTYDTWAMEGASTYTAGLTIGALEAALKMGDIVGDTSVSTEYNGWIAQAKDSVQKKLWNGRYYDVYEGKTDIMADAMAAQAFTRLYGLPDVFPEDQVRAHLQAVYDNNFRRFGNGSRGIVNGITPEGGILDEQSRDIQQAEVWIGAQRLTTALMYLYGMDDQANAVLESDYENTWDGPYAYRTPEAIVLNGNFREGPYMRAGAIFNILQALHVRQSGVGAIQALPELVNHRSFLKSLLSGLRRILPQHQQTIGMPGPVSIPAGWTLNGTLSKFSAAAQQSTKPIPVPESHRAVVARQVGETPVPSVSLQQAAPIQSAGPAVAVPVRNYTRPGTAIAIALGAKAGSSIHFSQQDFDALKNILDRIPADHLGSIRQIRYAHFSEAASLPKSREALFSSEGDGDVVMYVYDDRQRTGRDSAHITEQLARIVFERILSDAERQSWQAIGGDFVEEYGRWVDNDGDVQLLRSLGSDLRKNPQNNKWLLQKLFMAGVFMNGTTKVLWVGNGQRTPVTLSNEAMNFERLGFSLDLDTQVNLIGARLTDAAQQKLGSDERFQTLQFAPFPIPPILKEKLGLKTGKLGAMPPESSAEARREPFREISNLMPGLKIVSLTALMALVLAVLPAGAMELPGVATTVIAPSDMAGFAAPWIGMGTYAAIATVTTAAVLGIIFRVRDRRSERLATLSRVRAGLSRFNQGLHTTAAGIVNVFSAPIQWIHNTEVARKTREQLRQMAFNAAELRAA